MEHQPVRFIASMLFAAFAGIAPASADWVEAALSTTWHGSNSRDPITEAAVREIYLLTTVVNGAAFGNDQARVLISCSANKVRLVFDWTIKAGGKANLAVAYRFEGLPGRTIHARYVNRSKEESGSIEDIRQFLEDATASRSLYVRVSSDLYGANEATFQARGGPSAVSQLVEECPAVAPR